MVRRDEDETIMMPQGPAPILNAYNDTGNDSDSSNDCEGIRMPDGPPPPKAPAGPRANVIQPLPGQPPLPQGMPPLPGTPGVHFARPPPMHFQGAAAPSYQYGAYSGSRGHKPTHPLPSRPPPSTSQTNALPGPPPVKPSTVISAEPILRDLKKESTSFVPTAIRKKQAAEKAKAAKGGLPSAVNAAPGATQGREEQGELLTSLQSQIEQRAGPNNKTDEQDDYQKFLGNVQDLL
jgi:hypothetical protein